MRFKNIAVLNEDFSVSYGMDVWIDGAFIISVEETGRKGRPEASSGSAGREIDGTGKLLMPGFYNAHTHLPMTLMRGYGENLPLADWMAKKIFPFEDRLTGTDCYYASSLAIAESFSHGIVSSSDMYFFCDDIVRAAIDAGAKINASRGLSFFDEILDLTGFKPYEESKALFREYHGEQDGRIRVDNSLHGEYTATPGLIEAVSGLVSETGAPVHVHVSETREEHEGCKERNQGRTPVQVLADSGVFDNGGIAAHCVWIEEDDANILKEKGITMVTCPISNMKLASGIARVPLILEKGINVALGTDSAASNNSYNFFETIKMTALLAKVRFDDPTLITPGEALYMATRAGAVAQGRQDCGVIKEGNRADMVVLDINAASLYPVYEMANNLVYAASSRDIVATIVDGKVVYEKGEFPTIDIERAIYETERAGVRILDELGETAGVPA